MAPVMEDLIESAPAAQLDPEQTLKASTALLSKIRTDAVKQNDSSTSKANLLEDADDSEASDDVPIWLVLSTKKHITDKTRLKPGKILLPHPYLSSDNPTLRICLITADPQRKYKDLIAEPSFDTDLAPRIKRVIGLSKLKAKFKTFELRRQLMSEYDVFLADDRVITFLPQLLGKVFYDRTSKRPVPINLQGKKQTFDENGNKRLKLSEGGTKAVKADIQPGHMAHEIRQTLACTLVYVASSATTAVKVGKASMSAEQVQENIAAVVDAMVQRYVPQKWRNLRSLHIKGPDTAAMPIWLTPQLWEDEQDVLDEAPAPVTPLSKGQKRRKGKAAAIEAGRKRKRERDGTEGRELIESSQPDEETEKTEKAARKLALQEQKSTIKAALLKRQP